MEHSLTRPFHKYAVYNQVARIFGHRLLGNNSQVEFTYHNLPLLTQTKPKCEFQFSLPGFSFVRERPIANKKISFYLLKYNTVRTASDIVR